MYESIEWLIAEYPELRYRSVAHYVEVAVGNSPEYLELIKNKGGKAKVQDFIPKVKPKNPA